MRRYAPFMLDIALNFDVDFDQEPLRRYLHRREREGRQELQDQVARFRLLQHFGEPSDILAYLDEAANALKEIIPQTALASTKIHALIKDERVADAEKELKGYVDIFSESDYERHRLMIAGRKGEELKQLETLYRQTGQYQDLANLVHHLERTQQWEALLPYARELLAARRAAVCLRTVIRAMQQTGTPDEDILTCIDEHRDLIVPRTVEGDELLFYKGLALFGLGRFAEAEEIVTNVAKSSRDPNAISLEINIALRTGQWEHFTSIVDREFPRLQEFSAPLLLQMASVVADWDQDRAMKIVHIAAEKEPENGEIQANAYGLAARIGRDMDATTSLERMIRLAQQGKGPVRRVTLQEIVETLPTHAEQRREWEQKYITGEISLHQAAISLNMPVAQPLVGEFLRNENETDPRRRTVIPIRHGGRGPVKLSDIHNLAFDLSSLLVLETLGVLEAAFNATEKIYLSPRLMDSLFIEQQRVRFHQPSRVEEAKRILKLVDDAVIKLLPEVRLPEHLVEEVGQEIACLLHMAQTNNGRVLSTLPIHKAGSLNDEDADLREFGSLVMKTTQFLLHLKPYISPEAYAHARSFLASVDHGELVGENDWRDGPLYIADLALSYLDTAGILQHLHRLNREIFVADSVKAKAKDLVDAAEHGDEIASILERLRKRIQENIQSGKIIFLPESRDRKNQEAFLSFEALLDVFETTENTDAVCLDDRVFGKHAHLTAQHGRNIPIVGSIDILEYLSAQSLITEEKKRTCDFRLRKGGVAFLPLDVDGLLTDLKDSIDGSQTQFTENGTLAAVRENLQRVRSMKFLRISEEGRWLSQMAYATRELLKQIWIDSTIKIELAQEMSDWIFDVLAPLPTDWRESIVQDKEEDVTEQIKSVLLSLIYTGAALTDEERRRAFTTWIDRRLLGPLVLANVTLVDDISQIIQAFLGRVHTFERFNDECEADEEGEHHIQLVEPRKDAAESLQSAKEPLHFIAFLILLSVVRPRFTAIALGRHDRSRS